MGLKNYITSDYMTAANTLRGKSARKRIVAYVESYDDILFWRMILSRYENEKRYFEVMLPCRSSLSKGKKQALLMLMKDGIGPGMLACVDADYDYLIDGKTHTSQFMKDTPYVIHTYAYAIENLQCYAPSLHNVCVMATLNDHVTFDFETYLSEYSRAIFPLFVWSIMLYRLRKHELFSITDFNKATIAGSARHANHAENIKKLKRRVDANIGELRKTCTGLKEEYLKTKKDLQRLGVTPATTYLYIQGHHLFNNIVSPLLQTVCEQLRREREEEIKSKALHPIQLQNELSAYNNSQSSCSDMLKKNFNYNDSMPYQRILKDIEQTLHEQNND